MSLFRKQGGQDGVITGYKFEAKVWESDKKGVDPYTKLNVTLEFRPDGAEEDTKRFMDGGFLYDGTTVSDDGQNVESENEGAIIQENSEFARFIASFIEQAPPMEALLEAGEGRNFAAITGARVQLVNWVDEEATKKFGKRKVKSGPNKGKEYARTELRIGKVYALPEEGAKKGTKAASKPAAAAPKGGTKKAPKKDEPDTSVADTAIVAMVGAAKDGVLLKKSIGPAVVRYALSAGIKGDEREALRKQLVSEDYLEDATARGIVVYDNEAGTITGTE